MDATRFLWAPLHGFVSLETDGGFALPVDLDRSKRRPRIEITALTPASLD